MNKCFPDKRTALLLILILAGGAALRFYGLSVQSLWVDELYSWKAGSYDSLSTVINRGARPDWHPPGYHVLIHLVEKYCGDSETVLRLPSALFGVLSIFMIFLLGVELFSHREGLLAAAFVAILEFPIFQSQDNRAYSMLLLFSSAATYFWIRIVRDLEKESRLSLWQGGAYVLSAVLTCYAHYFGLLFVFLQGCGATFLFLRNRKDLLRVILLYVVVLAAFLPWLPAMLEQLGRLESGPLLRKPKIDSFFRMVSSFFNGSRKDPAASAVLLILVLIPLSFFVFSTGRRIVREQSYRKLRSLCLSPEILLLLWLVLPFLAAYVKSVVGTSILTYKNLIMCAPAAYLLLARALLEMPFPARGRAVLAGAFLALFLCHLLFWERYYGKPCKEQWREAVGFIIENDQRYGDALIIGSRAKDWFDYSTYYDYYFAHLGSSRRVEVRGGLEQDIQEVSKAIRQSKGGHVWLIHAHLSPDAKFMEFLNETLEQVSVKEFMGARVWLFRMKTPERPRAAP